MHYVYNRLLLHKLGVDITFQINDLLADNA